MDETIRQILEQEIGPGLADEGISVELLSVDDGVVHVRFDGLAEDNVSDRYALQISILQRLKEDLPDLKRVESDGSLE